MNECIDSTMGRIHVCLLCCLLVTIRELAFFTFQYFGPFTPLFFFLLSTFLCFLSIRVGATTNLEGGSGRAVDLPSFI